MGKRKTKPPAERNRVKLVMFEGTLTVDGVTRTVKNVDYERIEFEDGTVQERGRPAGLPENPSIDDVIRKAFEE